MGMRESPECVKCGAVETTIHFIAFNTVGTSSRRLATEFVNSRYYEVYEGSKDQSNSSIGPTWSIRLVSPASSEMDGFLTIKKQLLFKTASINFLIEINRNT